MTTQNTKPLEPIIVKDNGTSQITLAFENKEIEAPPEETKTLADFTRKKDFAKKYPHLVSETEVEWIYKNRDKNGFAEAFKHIGRKPFVNDRIFYEILSSRST
jgi:hypothetical protein